MRGLFFCAWHWLPLLKISGLAPVACSNVPLPISDASRNKIIGRGLPFVENVTELGPETWPSKINKSAALLNTAFQSRIQNPRIFVWSAAVTKSLRAYDSWDPTLVSARQPSPRVSAEPDWRSGRTHLRDDAGGGQDHPAAAGIHRPAPSRNCLGAGGRTCRPAGCTDGDTLAMVARQPGRHQSEMALRHGRPTSTAGTTLHRPDRPASCLRAASPPSTRGSAAPPDAGGLHGRLARHHASPRPNPIEETNGMTAARRTRRGLIRPSRLALAAALALAPLAGAFADGADEPLGV